MAQQQIVWTVLPCGREEADVEFRGRWRVSIVVAPRLTPEAADEQVLKAFEEWLDWPATLANCKFALEIGAAVLPLIPLQRPQTAPDSALWQRLFPPTLPVAGFQFKDMSQANLRSYPVRNVMGLVRRHYETLSLQAGAGEHPTLLPWRAADPALKDLLGELGTRTQKVNFGDRALEVPLPGFSRFHDDAPQGPRGERLPSHDAIVDRGVFGPDSCVKAPVPRAPGDERRPASFALRALPPDWEDPALIRNGSIAVAPADREKRAQLMEQFAGPAEYALWQSDRFYRRSVPTDAQRAMRRPGYEGAPAPIAPPEYDFHQRVASYADHPQLLRRLGLVIDCVLDSNDALDALLAAGEPALGTLRLRLRSGPPHQTSGDQFPLAAFKATKRRFVLQARGSDTADGLLRLARTDDRYRNLDPREGSAFDLYQLDPDGAALKTVDFLLSAQNLVGKSLQLGAGGGVTYTTGDKQPVATLRSGGIGVSRHGRAGEVAMAAAAAAANHQRIASGGAGAAQMTLYAEDVQRGYRIDIHDKAADRWRSLCDRQGRYVALAREAGEADMAVDLPPDEGYVKGASTTSSEDKPDDHYLHETLFRWTGWSLAVPRPGRTLKDRLDGDSQLQTEEVTDIDETADVRKGNGLAVKLSPVKGALPRLRFGQEYRVRARLVDLAGNSLALDDRSLEPLEQATEPIVYGRFEPVDPPALLLQRRLSEGESLERLVLRSNHDRSCADYTADTAGAMAAFYDNPDFRYGATSERHLVPPKTSQQTCELHGMFDAAIGSGDPARIKQAYATAARESGSLMQQVPGADIELVTPSATAAVATVQGEGALIPPPEQADGSKDRFAAGQYLIHREATVPVPYLPDPACGGIALHGVPGVEALVAGKPLQLLAPGLTGVVLDRGLRAALVPKAKAWVLLVDFDSDPGDDPGEHLQNDWPDDLRSLRLVLAEQPGEVETPPCGPDLTAPAAPQWDLAAGVLTLFLPKGHIARLRYASFVHDKLVDHFGLPGWQAAAGRQQLRAEALAGVNWMLTPWRGLTLVHATQQPVCEPRLEIMSVGRAVGAAHADLLARRVLLHGPSTGKFEIVGEWSEWIDDPLNDDPAQPGPRRVRHQAQLSEIRLADNHANLFVLQDAVQRQNEFVPVGGQVQAGDLAKRPAVPGNRHEFGDTRFRFVRYHLRATTRFREYLPPKLFADAARITREGPVNEEDRVDIRTLPGQDADTDAGAPVLQIGGGEEGLGGTVVPASAPPDPPHIVYVVPTFRWERPAEAGGRRHSTRHGNGLRVYLERPWFSSGDGELLGVVLLGDDKPFSQIDGTLLPFVTQWGRDPLWDSGMPSTRTRVSDFAAAAADESVVLPDEPTRLVHVVGHRVHFDADRKLWYCDIELNAGASYMPFVRLALVRYQPNAIPDAKVSRVVLAEFAQVLPRRRAVLQRRGQAVTVDVHGPIPERGPMRQRNPGGVEEPPYAGISFIPSPGAAGESGRNRMELVLQTRDAAIDSDLAWEDQSVLADGMVGETPSSPAPAGGGLAVPLDRDPPLVRRIADASLKVRSRAGQTLRFDRLQEVAPTRAAARKTAAASGGGASMGSITAGIGVIDQVPKFPSLFDPAVWAGTATLPAVPEGRVGRLMLREFERFYTDRTVPEVRAGAVRRRIVVEERLVYAEMFEL